MKTETSDALVQKLSARLEEQSAEFKDQLTQVQAQFPLVAKALSLQRVTILELVRSRGSLGPTVAALIKSTGRYWFDFPEEILLPTEPAHCLPDYLDCWAQAADNQQLEKCDQKYDDCRGLRTAFPAPD